MLNMQTNRSEQTVHIQTKLLLLERFDQGLHYLPFNTFSYDQGQSNRVGRIMVLSPNICIVV